MGAVGTVTAGTLPVRPTLAVILTPVQEHALAERLITYDTSNLEGMQSAAGFVKGWLESRDVEVSVGSHNGRPVIAATVGAAAGAGPTVILHGHADVVPGRPEQFVPRVDGDRLYGRGAYDMKGGLAAMMVATRDLAEQKAVRVHFVCVCDEESDEVDAARFRLPGRTGLHRRFRHHRRAHRPAHRRAGQGRARHAHRGDRQSRTRLDPLGGRQRRAQGGRRLPPDRVASVRARVVGVLRPAVDQPRPHHRRRRDQQGAGPVRDRRGRALPAGPGRGGDPRGRRARSPTCPS